MQRRSDHDGVRGWVRCGALLGAATAAFVSVTAAVATFTSGPTGGPMTVTSKRIFPGVRSTSAHDLRDASTGTESNKSDANSYADGLTSQTSTGIASGTNRYVEYTLDSSRPGGLSVSEAQFNYRLASVNGAGNSCFWFDVRSGGTVIGTHGSYATAAACSTGTIQTTVTTSIPEVTSTDQLNGLVIRAYVWETGSKKINVDLATVTGSTAYSSFTAFEDQVVDDTSGTPATAAWPLATGGDNASYQSGNWTAAFAAARYLKVTFSPDVPSGSVITGATFDLSYRPNNSADTVCWYMEVYNGAALIGTHGSSGSPISCKAGNATFQTDNVSIPEVDTVANANNLVVKLYMRNSGNRPSQTDLARVNLNYYLD